MHLSEKTSEDIIQIFHNAKLSFIHDILKWTHGLHDNNNEPTHLNASENRNPEKDSSSIFENQRTSEYSQQPIPPSDDNEKPRKEEGLDELEKSEQISSEQREALENQDRQENIEERRADYEGFMGDQR